MTDTDWSLLPNDLLKFIAERLRAVEDYVCFGRVCRSWRLATLLEEAPSNPKLPWLMLIEHDHTDVRGFYSPSSNRTYQLQLPQSQGKRCWGSPYGWLVVIGTDFQLHLLNPLSRAQIALPPLHKCRNINQLVCTAREFRDVFANKVVLSSDPSSLESYVMAIYLDYRKMAFVKLGEEKWTPLECSSSSTAFEDIIFINGNFFAIDCSEHVLVFNSNGVHTSTIALTLIPPVNDLDCEAKYLVELRQEIYMVIRCLYETRITDVPCWRTWGFAVFKLDLFSEKWRAVECLDGFSLFLGNNYSFSLLAADCPGFRGNCIYFTDDYFALYNGTVSSYDMGIYNFEDHKIESYPVEDGHVSVYSPPVWFKPSFK